VREGHGMAIGTGQGETEAEGEVKLSTSNGDRVLSPIVAAVDISGVSPVFPIIFINGRCPRDTLSPKCSVESHPFSEWREDIRPSGRKGNVPYPDLSIGKSAGCELTGIR
jgi:hypothetical protein